MEQAILRDPVWLNLGCGRRYMDGWINVDAIDKEKVDVIADIRELDFDNDYADRILANHVIEHFFRWEVLDILKEWKRILKKGGELILECPDLSKILRNFNTSVDPYAHMYGLYGDIIHKDPLMAHKWAYTGWELSALVEKAGFKDVKIEDPQYHRMDRDMRITGIC